MSLLSKLKKFQILPGDKMSVLESHGIDLNSDGLPLQDAPVRATLVEQEITRKGEKIYAASLEFPTYFPAVWELSQGDHANGYWQIKEALEKKEGYELRVTSEGLINLKVE